MYIYIFYVFQVWFAFFFEFDLFCFYLGEGLGFKDVMMCFILVDSSRVLVQFR